MTSYLRSLFSVGPHHGPARSSKSKGHQRSNSTPPVEQRPASYVFIKTGSSSSKSSSGSSASSSRPRTSSYSSVKAQQPPAPSPLRHTTFDSASSHGHRSRSSRRSSQERPAMPQRSSSYRREKDQSSPYSIYAPRVSFSSTHSASSSSVARPGSSASHYAPPRNPSTGSISSQASNPRPALKQNHTWHGSAKPHNPNAHVTFMNPSRTQTLHMHPVLAYTRQSQAPISYDVTYPPSSRTVVDRNTRAPVPSHTLQQPATDPIGVPTLVLTSEKFPWEVNVSSNASSKSSGPKFYLGGTSQARKASSATPVTNNDVLHTLHDTLSVRVTQEEWDHLGSGSKDQKRIWKAYESRCDRMGGGWKSGIRRIDYLGDKTRLVGIEVDKNASGGGRGRLVFARP